MQVLLRLALRLLLLSLILMGPHLDARAAQRNVLLIIADDLRVDAASFYPLTADRRATTPPAPPMPTLKGLARKGVIFRNAWAEPWCSPSRAAVFTGRYPFRTGLGTPIPREHKPHPVLSPDEFGLPKAFEAGKPGQYALAH